MANPYVYGADGSYDQRWADKNNTTTTRLDVARKMADWLRYALSTFMDPALASTFGLWENPLILGGTTGLYTWYDVTNDCERKKSGSAPNNETDGVISGAGGMVP